mmetsp:Transcript_9020/g.22948  ORF Transcript_9020/g.22948 Transcript_9020/m.22948 type:complete len:252 (-) Transcript_9020:259-1014(-)
MPPSGPGAGASCIGRASPRSATTSPPSSPQLLFPPPPTRSRPSPGLRASVPGTICATALCGSHLSRPFSRTALEAPTIARSATLPMTWTSPTWRKPPSRCPWLLSAVASLRGSPTRSSTRSGTGPLSWCCGSAFSSAGSSSTARRKQPWPPLSPLSSLASATEASLPVCTLLPAHASRAPRPTLDSIWHWPSLCSALARRCSGISRRSSTKPRRWQRSAMAPSPPFSSFLGPRLSRRRAGLCSVSSSRTAT